MKCTNKSASSLRPFKASFTIGVASVRIDDDPDAWKQVKAAMGASGSLKSTSEISGAFTIAFDGDLDNPQNFADLAIVANSFTFRSKNLSKGQFGDVSFVVIGKVSSIDREVLEDLFHLFIIELSANDASVNVGDWEEYFVEGEFTE